MLLSAIWGMTWNVLPAQGKGNILYISVLEKGIICNFFQLAAMLIKTLGSGTWNVWLYLGFLLFKQDLPQKREMCDLSVTNYFVGIFI